MRRVRMATNRMSSIMLIVSERLKDKASSLLLVRLNKPTVDELESLRERLQLVLTVSVVRAIHAVTTVVKIDVRSCTLTVRSFTELISSLRALRASRHRRDIREINLRLAILALLLSDLLDLLRLCSLDRPSALIASDELLNSTELFHLLAKPRTDSSRQLSSDCARDLVTREVPILIELVNIDFDLIFSELLAGDSFEASIDSHAFPFCFNHVCILLRLFGQSNFILHHETK